jgi:outer membrane protein TolC
MSSNHVTAIGARTWLARARSFGLLCLLGFAGLSGRAAGQQPDPLGGLVREALARNLGQRQHQLEAERSDAAVRQARGLFLPSVSLDARYSEMHGGLDFGDLVNPAYAALNQLTGRAAFPTNIDGRFPYAQETRLRVVQPLFNAQILSNHRLSTSLRGVQAARTRAAARQLAADVQLAYVNYARAGQLVEVLRVTHGLVQEQVRVTERLLSAGKVTADARHRAIAERSDIEQQQADAEQKQGAAARYLNFLLDRPVEAAIEELPDSALLIPLVMDLPTALQRARVAREELEQADFGVRATDAQQRLARASNLPSLSVAVDYGVQGHDYRLDRGNDFAMASLVVQWPVLNGLQDGARRQQAALDGERARVQREELERQIELQVRQAFAAVVAAQRSLQAARDRVTAARRSYELAARRFEEGMSAPVELLDARTAYTAAQINQVLTRFEYGARYIGLERVAALRDLDTDLGRTK